MLCKMTIEHLFQTTSTLTLIVCNGSRLFFQVKLSKILLNNFPKTTSTSTLMVHLAPSAHLN